MSDKSVQYREVFKSFSLVLDRLSVPSAQHPFCDDISHLFSILESILKEDKEIIFAPGAGPVMMSLNHESMAPDMPGVREMHDGLQGLGITQVMLSQGVVLGEVEDFIKALAKATMGTGSRPAHGQVFCGSEHIAIQRSGLDNTPGETATISKKTLDRLMNISERFEQELRDRVKIATEELTRLNQRLADEKERTDAIVRHVAEGVVVVNKEGRILMMNPAAERLLDSKAKESLGKYLVQSLKDEHLLAVAKDLDNRKGLGLTKEIQLDSKDEATKRILRASTAVVENENGDTVGMVSVLSDITHEKQIEEIKSQFVSLVTHELRTPVVAIQKSLELIDSGVTGPVNDDQKRFLDISKLNLARLNSLINDLLDMSKLEAGKLILFPSSFDIRGIIKEVKTSLLSWIRDKEITVCEDLPQARVQVNADKDRMIQVMVNLVGNALKFTPKKGSISISLKSLDRKEKICEEPCVEIAVSDSGIGIDPKDSKRIFNKFEQVSLVSPVGTGGTGLGLSIAKEIINLHGGDIWVESQVGHGSTFTFVIPQAFRGGEHSVQ
jgi:PAS domain S-box-containing protein